jgi:hypothetical protein
VLIMSLLKSVTGRSLAALRVIFLLVFIIAALLSSLLRVSVASAEEGLMALGQHLAVVAEQGLGTDGRGVLINGQVVGFRVLTTSKSLESALDFYELWCREGSGVFSEELEAVEEMAASVGIDRSWKDLTMRSQSGPRGYVACIQQPGHRPDIQTLQARLAAFNKSGDLSELGRFHYVYATDLGQERRVVAVWTQGPFRPYALFPADGDAPGEEIPGIPRPPSGRRSLSAGELGTPQTLNIYIECEQSAEELAGFYREQLVRNQWTLLSDVRDESGGILLAIERGEEVRFLHFGSADGESWVAIGGGKEVF